MREREGGFLLYISCHLLPPLAGRLCDGCVGVSPPSGQRVLFSERPGKVSAVKQSFRHACRGLRSRMFNSESVVSLTFH